MKLEVSRVGIWTVSVKDRPGGLVGKLEPLAKAGAILNFFLPAVRLKNPAQVWYLLHLSKVLHRRKQPSEPASKKPNLYVGCGLPVLTSLVLQSNWPD